MKVTPLSADGQPVQQAAPAPKTDPKPAAPVAAEPSKAQPVATSDASKAEDTDLKPRFAELARKEQTIRSVAMQLKQKEADLKANFISKADLTKDLVGTLLSAGISQEVLNSLVAPAAPKADAPSPEIEALKAEIEALKKGKEDDQKSAYDGAIKQLKRDAEKLVESDPEFATIKASKRADTVVELIEKNFKATGEIWTVAEAAKLIEEELRSEFAEYAKLDTVKKKLAPPTEAEAPASEPTKPQEQRLKKSGMPAKVTPRTPVQSNLTHKLNSNRPLTARERAIAAFHGKNE
jgi:hypothetical protein